MPRNVEDLTLVEQLLLLALRDEKGTVAFRASQYGLALGGAILVDLLLGGRLRIGEDKKHRVEAVGATRRIGDPILDECLEAISTSPRRRTAETWVARFAQMRRLKHRVAEGLCRKGVLSESEDSVLLIFTRKVYPTFDSAPERRLVEQMREAIFGNGDAIEPRVAAVVGLAHATSLLGIHFPRKELRARKARLAQMAQGGLIGGSRDAPLRAAIAAVIAAVRKTVVVHAVVHGVP